MTPDPPAPPRLPPARLLLVRHGESTWNRLHRIQGQLDPPLSELGRKQAQLLARRLAVQGPRVLYTSDLRRAAETAAPIVELTGIEPRTIPELREIFLGEWEGLQTEEVGQRFPDAWARWTDEPSWDLVPGGEGGAAFEARVGAALERIFDEHPHEEVVVVTHGGVVQIALHGVVGRPSRGFFPFRIANASISIIEKRGGRMVIDRVNDVGHLEAPTAVAD